MRVACLLIAFGFTAAPSVVLAHEPLWGETPQTFSFGLKHPEWRFGFEDSRRLFQGSRRIPNVDGRRHLMSENHLSFQYAPQTTLNLKAELPLVRMESEERIGGVTRRSSSSGIGDLVLSAKSRFHSRFGEDWKIMHSWTGGIQLPTGKNDARHADGELMPPSEQAGTGNFGIHLGYAFAWEWLQDSTWASIMYGRDLSGNRRKGDVLTLDAAYGYWFVRASRPQDLGVILAVGPHVEIHGKDRVSGGADPNTGFDRTGLQATLIATKGDMQFRIGALVPVRQRYNGTQLGADTEFRAGWEMFF